MAFFITSINIIVHLKFYGCTVYQCLAGDYESYDDFIIEYCKNCGGEGLHFPVKIMMKA